MFQLDLIETPSLERIDGGYCRLYKKVTGELYPSVTSVLAAMSENKSGLDDWIARVGKEEAARVTQRSGRRGSGVHKLCEDYILENKIDKSAMPLNLMMFKQLQRVLDAHVDHIRGVETFLYSDRLKLAGATDLIGSYDGIPSIIDFKTSAKAKKEEWIENYFLQATAYSYMLYERTGLDHRQLVILISLEEELEAQVIISHADLWIRKLAEKCRTFHKTIDYLNREPL